MQNQTKVQNLSFNVLLVSWVIFVALYAVLKNSPPLENLAGVLLSVAVVGSSATAFIYAFQIWKKSRGKSKLIFSFFVLSLLSVVITDIIYEGTYNILHLTHTPLPAFTATIYFTFLVFQLFAWLCLLPKITSSVKKAKDLALYIPFIIILAFMLLMFATIIKLEITRYQLSSISFYNILYAILGFSSFIMAMLCLATSKHKGLFYLALGFLVAKTGGLVMIFGTFAQKFGSGSIMETLWVLSHFIMAYGFINFIRTESYNTDPKTWVHPINSLRTQISFWVFSIFILSAFIGYIVYYLATSHSFLQSINDLQILFPALCLYSIITVIFSKLFSNKISAYLSKLEELASGVIYQEKNHSIPETETLYIKQVANDIYSSLETLNNILKQSSKLPKTKKALIKNAVKEIGNIADNLYNRDMLQNN